jgi:hypothetical protein
MSQPNDVSDKIKNNKEQRKDRVNSRHTKIHILN